MIPAFRPLILILLLALSLPPAATADEFDDLMAGGGESAEKTSSVTFDFGGHALGRLFMDTNRDNATEDLAEVRTLLFAQGIMGFSEKVSVVLSGYGEFELGTNYEDTDTAYAGKLWEFYITLRLGDFDLLLGQQLVTWGILDAANPVNNVNPIDFGRMFVYLNEDYNRIPLPLARATWYFADNFYLEGLYLPFFRPMEIDLAGDDWALLGPSIPVSLIKKYLDRMLPYDDWQQTLSMFFPEWEEELGRSEDLFQSLWENSDKRPPDDFSEPELGLRLGGSYWLIDFAVSYLWGLDDTPTLHLSPEIRSLIKAVADPEKYAQDLQGLNLHGLLEPFELRYHRISTIGLEFGITWEGIGFRAEAAYRPDRRAYTKELEVVSRGQINWSASIDYNFAYDIIAVGQWLQIAQTNYTEDQLGDQYLNIAMVVLRKTFWRELLEVYLAGIYDLTFLTDDEARKFDLFSEDFVLASMLTFTVTDPLKLQLGGTFFGGDQLAYLGYLKDNNQIWLSIKYSF